MPTVVRIAVVGAGSAQFSLGLIRDLCLTAELGGSTVVFLDVDPDRLATVATLAARYAAEMGSDLRVERTQEREAALADADFVVNTALAGGHGREEAERALLDQHGYHRGLHPAEGFFHQYDLMREVARDVERLCPDAWLIQSSNPVFDGCTLMTRETGAKVVGLCHGPFGGIRELVETLGLDPGGVAFEAPGVNHCVWLTQFRYHGQDAYPLLDRWIEEESAAYWSRAEPAYGETQLSPAAIDLYRFYGLLPLGDTSRAIGRKPGGTTSTRRRSGAGGRRSAASTRTRAGPATSPSSTAPSPRSKRWPPTRPPASPRRSRPNRAGSRSSPSSTPSPTTAEPRSSSTFPTGAPSPVSPTMSWSRCQPW